MTFLSDYLKTEYNEKLYRLSFDLGCTCPNRDGTKGFGGCSFCSEGGSGDFAEKILRPEDVDDAVERAKGRVSNKFKGDSFIAYFQSFTNTYGDLDRLTAIYEIMAVREEIKVISIATRPDCLGPEVISMLTSLKQKKPVWVELGLQTINDEVAKKFNRGYDLVVFEEAYRRLVDAGIPVIVHVILGLPGENKDDMRKTVAYLGQLKPELFGIKLSMLHVLKGTRLGSDFQNGNLSLYEFKPEEYAGFVWELLGYLPESTVVHRMSGDGPKKDLLFPLWSSDKKRMVNLLYNRKPVG